MIKYGKTMEDITENYVLPGRRVRTVNGIPAASFSTDIQGSVVRHTTAPGCIRPRDSIKGLNLECPQIYFHAC
jgi:hypothetical protein